MKKIEYSRDEIGNTCLYLNPRAKVVSTELIEDWLIVDYDRQGNIVSIDILSEYYVHELRK